MKILKEVIEEQREIIQDELVAFLGYTSDDSDKLISIVCEMVVNQFDIILEHEYADRIDRDQALYLIEKSVAKQKP